MSRIMSRRLVRQAIASSGGMPGWVQPGALFDEDFFNQRAWPRPFESEMVDTRASTQYVPNASGVWVPVSSGVLPISSAYMEVEPSSTNSIRNSALQGIVAGSPGTMPTNMGVQQQGTLSRTIGAATTLNGLDVFSLRLNGTTSTTFTNIAFETNGAIAAANGQTWVPSLFMATVAGAFTNIGTMTYGAALYDSGVLYIGELSGRTDFKSSLTSSLFRCSVSGATIASTAFMTPYFQLAFSIGVAIDITLLIGMPKNEPNALTSPVRTTGTAATRAANAITLQRTGIGRVVYTFDNDTQQTVSGINTGAQYTIPTNLNRPLIKRMTGYAS
jgi:hypothetical protein